MALYKKFKSSVTYKKNFTDINGDGVLKIKNRSVVLNVSTEMLSDDYDNWTRFIKCMHHNKSFSIRTQYSCISSFGNSVSFHIFGGSAGEVADLKISLPLQSCITAFEKYRDSLID